MIQREQVTRRSRDMSSSPQPSPPEARSGARCGPIASATGASSVRDLHSSLASSSARLPHDVRPPHKRYRELGDRVRMVGPPNGLSKSP